jgi:hypothetical protein
MDSLSYELQDVFHIASSALMMREDESVWEKDNGEHVWLFDALDVPALRICPNLRLIPNEVRMMLSSYPGKLVLAGGSALAIAVEGVGSGSDFDMFLVDVDADEASRILHEIEMSFKDQPGCSVLITRHAMTIVFDDKREPIQIIMRLHSCVAGVLLSFDIAAARVGLSYDSIGVLRMWCTDTWVACVQHRMFMLESVFWGRGSVARIIKYVGKGFNCMVPVGRQHLMRNKGEDLNDLIQYGRLSGLFSAERLLLMRRLRRANVSSYGRHSDIKTSSHRMRSPWWWSLLGCRDSNGGYTSLVSLRDKMHSPLTYDECKLIAFSVSVHSDYDLAAKATRKLRYVVRGIRNALLKLGLSLGYLNLNFGTYTGDRWQSLLRLNGVGDSSDSHNANGASDSNGASDTKKYTFMKTSSMGMFYPTDICFDEVYNLD